MITEKKSMAEKTTIVSPHRGFQEKFVSSNVDFVIGGGVLNPQPTDSLIATPNGFVRMGDIKIGDEICDTIGSTQKVLFVIDKGMQDCVEFTTLDGRKVQSALSHNWRIKTTHNRVFEWTAQQIVDYINEQERKNVERGRRKTETGGGVMRDYDGLVKRLRSQARLERYYNTTGKTLNEAADAIEELSKPSWIPVTERLPEEGKSVLVCICSDGKYDITRGWYCKNQGFCCWDDAAMESADFITHWMPLPEPPKGE
jgi:hypothetical protein